MKFNHTKFNIFLFGVMIGVIGLGLYTIYTYTERGSEIRDYIPESEEEIIDNCSNLSIVKAANCLVDNINPFYSYTPTKDIRKLNLEDLKRRGGDCKDWSELYVRLGKELGFYARSFVIDTNNMSRHQIAVLSNEYAYCLIDSTANQSFSRCIGFE